MWQKCWRVESEEDTRYLDLWIGRDWDRVGELNEGWLATIIGDPGTVIEEAGQKFPISPDTNNCCWVSKDDIQLITLMHNMFQFENLLFHFLLLTKGYQINSGWSYFYQTASTAQKVSANRGLYGGCFSLAHLATNTRPYNRIIFTSIFRVFFFVFFAAFVIQLLWINYHIFHSSKQTVCKHKIYHCLISSSKVIVIIFYSDSVLLSIKIRLLSFI